MTGNSISGSWLVALGDIEKQRESRKKLILLFDQQLCSTSFFGVNLSIIGGNFDLLSN
jgi:hypothetical protein